MGDTGPRKALVLTLYSFIFGGFMCSERWNGILRGISALEVYMMNPHAIVMDDMNQILFSNQIQIFVLLI